MTCFWDGILRSLDHQDFYKFSKDNKPLGALQFVEWLKKNNVYTENVKWNEEFPSRKNLEENFKAVEDFDKNTIGNGYYCSCFDPFLFLVCEIFKLHIIHNFNGVIIVYSHKNHEKNVKYKSDLGHFMNL